jgi:hypothetical protein
VKVNLAQRVARREESKRRLEESRINIAAASGLIRYCPMCDKWVPKSETVCKACGMDTERGDK